MTGNQKRKLQAKAENCYYDVKYAVERNPEDWNEEKIADLLNCGKCPWCDVCEIPRHIMEGE